MAAYLLRTKPFYPTTTDLEAEDESRLYEAAIQQMMQDELRATGQLR